MSGNSSSRLQTVNSSVIRYAVWFEDRNISIGYIGLTLIGLLFYNIFTYKRKSFSDTFYTYIFILVFSVQFLFTSPLFALCLAVFFVRDNNENVRNNDLMEKDIV